MSYFSTPTITVPIDGENSITLRALTFGEQQELQSRCMKVGATLNGRQTAGDVQMDVALMNRLTWHKAIQGWAGPGFDGRPVTPDNIDALPAWIFEFMAEAYNSLAKMTEQEKKA